MTKSYAAKRIKNKNLNVILLVILLVAQVFKHINR
jgi:hypothetical protein